MWRSHYILSVILIVAGGAMCGLSGSGTATLRSADTDFIAMAVASLGFMALCAGIGMLFVAILGDLYVGWRTWFDGRRGGQTPPDDANAVDQNAWPPPPQGQSVTCSAVLPGGRGSRPLSYYALPIILIVAGGAMWSLDGGTYQPHFAFLNLLGFIMFSVGICTLPIAYIRDRYNRPKD